MIFTPEWVGARLFDQTVIETQIALLPVFPIVYKHPQVVLQVGGSDLTFNPRFNSLVALETAEWMATRVLDLLPNTPLLGVGINFSFVESNPPRSLLDLFNHSDNGSLARNAGDVKESKLSRKLLHDSEILNLSLGYDNEKVTLEFNFHRDTNSHQTAHESVSGRVIHLRDSAISLLRDVYDLELEEVRVDE